MGYEPVDVYVKDQEQNPVSDVIVRIYSSNGGVFFTQQVTDETGKASFLLFTQQYSMRFYKFQVTFAQPQLFTVLDAPNSNVFDVAAEVLHLPVASDPRLCRCSGFFRSPDGSPQKYLDMHFYPEFSPVLLESAAVVPRVMAIRTDDDGYAQIDLIRGGCYRVTIEGMENEDRFIRVPDLSGANLPDVLYPVVTRVTFEEEGPYEILAGGEIELTPTVYDSAGTVLHGTGQNDVDWTVSDTDLASVSVGEFKLTVRGSTAGSIELRAARRDTSIIRIPSLPVSGQPITITIT